MVIWQFLGDPGRPGLNLGLLHTNYVTHSVSDFSGPHKFIMRIIHLLFGRVSKNMIQESVIICFMILLSRKRAKISRLVQGKSTKKGNKPHTLPFLSKGTLAPCTI